MKYYTGIGSRETPENICLDMELIAKKLAKRVYYLRSGAADRADKAFEYGCDRECGLKEIYLPWKGFNESNSLLYNIPKEAFDIASRIHPAWSKCSFGAKKLHARNICQVLGLDLKTPSEFLICWTKNGQVVGGTATAINLAIEYNIPVHNLYNGDFNV